ncbi:ComEC/Rec2 family competence protein [Roseomonas nepalensis]|uniref:ComEC/Rec2 family competence protein n=1 Tax=Muricoccus nepalensis TaxID=1854500 RepID=A0A502GHZ3_9PROT|nr:ComEC/Rec2 family competence protein [Roseomonas nepalensis]
MMGADHAHPRRARADRRPPTDPCRAGGGVDRGGVEPLAALAARRHGRGRARLFRASGGAGRGLDGAALADPGARPPRAGAAPAARGGAGAGGGRGARLRRGDFPRGRGAAAAGAAADRGRRQRARRGGGPAAGGPAGAAGRAAAGRGAAARARGPHPAPRQRPRAAGAGGRDRGARADPPTDAAGLSRRLRLPARRLLLGPGGVRLCAQPRGDHRAGGGALLRRAPHRDRDARDRGPAGGNGGGLGGAAHRVAIGHPAGRARGAARLRPRAPALALRPARRHRHRPCLRCAPGGNRGHSLACAALRFQGGGGGGGPCPRRRLHAAHRGGGADGAVLRHGRPLTLAILTGRRALSPRALAVAAALVLLFAPEALVGPSFQMSFAAVLALIAAAEAMRGPTRRLRERGGAGRLALLLIGLMGTSIVAGAATTPFGLHHFGRLQLYGVAANAVAVPLTSFVVMPAGMLAAFLMPLGWEGPALAVMGWGVDATLLVGRTVASWPGAALSAAPIPAWGLGLFSLGMLWLCLWRLPWRWAGVPLMAAGLLSGLATAPPDILLAADGRMLAVATPAGVLSERASGSSRLTRESWLRAWGEDDAAALPREGEVPGAACTPLSCLLRPRGDGPAAVLLRAPPREGGRGRRAPAGPVLAETGCGEAAVLVSLEPIRGRCRDVPRVDRFSAWRDGSHAIWLGRDGVVVLSDRAFRGDRPWVPPVPVPRAQPQAEPPAETE